MKTISIILFLIFPLFIFCQGFNPIPIPPDNSNPILENVTEVDTLNWGTDNDTYNEVLQTVTETDTSRWGFVSIQEPDSFTFMYSARHFLDLDVWRSFNNAYGAAFHQVNQGIGSNANPNITFRSNGYNIPFDSEFLSMHLNGYHNNAEQMDIEIDVTCFSSVDDTNIINIKWRVKKNYKSNSTSTRLISIPINQAVSRNDEIVVSIRKKIGSGTRRYLYANATMHFEK